MFYVSGVYIPGEPVEQTSNNTVSNGNSQYIPLFINMLN